MFDPIHRRPAARQIPRSPQSVNHLERQHGGTAVLLTGVALGFPVSMLMLAKLTGSDTLGWVFGLTLLLEFAVLPWLALFSLGRWAQRISRGRQQ
jgi:hypothetical protein